ncbi:MAG: hypothetical protein AWT59_1004 [Candidatus Gallionella acididurans]|uniref:Uncharacterized protein n=1 Tax=Candidatus Gallionella acididurans TaxID=1796491 RepID=A0A139BVA3_9PROT|nr:MAG: hypothetical protein AWT59_1004 [Candidatus Gallionella acididurans]
MHLCLAGLLHFVRNDGKGVVNYGSINRRQHGMIRNRAGEMKKLARHSREFGESGVPRHCNKASAVSDGTNTCHCEEAQPTRQSSNAKPLD